MTFLSRTRPNKGIRAECDVKCQISIHALGSALPAVAAGDVRRSRSDTGPRIAGHYHHKKCEYCKQRTVLPPTKIAPRENANHIAQIRTKGESSNCHLERRCIRGMRTLRPRYRAATGAVVSSHERSMILRRWLIPLKTNNVTACALAVDLERLTKREQFSRRESLMVTADASSLV
jgi:hypothetical protein